MKPTAHASVLKDSGVLAIAAFVLAVLSACEKQTEFTPRPATTVQTDELWQTVSRLESQVLGLKARVETLESGAATASTEEQGYDIARTKFGPFTVSTRGVTPYLDGFKVKLRIGNLTNADFSGAKLKLGWGPPFEVQMFEKVEKYEEWQKAQKKKEMSFTNLFASGSFTEIEVVLTPAKPDEVKSFSVGFELDRLALRRPGN